MKTQSLIFATFVLALFCLGVTSMLDPDLGWHLKTGEWIAQNGIPVSDPFSYTVPGKSWVAHEWLSAWVMFSLFRALSDAGLILFFAGICVGTFLLVYFNAPSSSRYLNLLLVEWGAIILKVVWGIRPQVFNVLMLALFLFIVERIRRGAWKPAALWWLCPILILWQNLHSGFLLGLVILGVYWASDGWDQCFRKLPGDGAPLLSKGGRKTLLVVLFAGVTLSFLNPHGYALLTYPFETLMSSAQQDFINEWLSPNFHEARMRPFLVFILFSTLSFLFSKRRIQTSEVILFLGSLGAALISARHIPFFVLVAIPVVARNLEGLKLFGNFSTRQPETRFRKGVNGVLLIFFITAVGFWTMVAISKNRTEFPQQYPVKALAFLKKENSAGFRVFHVSHWGGFLILNNVPVFIDGRPDLYGDDFCMQYLKMLWFEKDWEKWSQALQFQYTLFPAGHSFNRFLKLQPGWELIYQDGTAEIFKKNV